jgi:putative transcriptional regulator
MSDTTRKTRAKMVGKRKKLGLTQQDLANRVKINRAYLSNIESGRYDPSLDVAHKISKVLKSSIEDTFF